VHGGDAEEAFWAMVMRETVCAPTARVDGRRSGIVAVN
jgi:hypothetical protein